jgi:hypothetical protein
MYGGEGELLTILMISGVIFGVICAAIWSNKGGSGVSGFLIGLLLGLIGLIVVAVATPGGGVKAKAAASRECPHCKELMRRDASVCPHCQRDSAPWVFHEGRWWFRDAQGDNYYLDERTSQWVKV